MLKKSDNRLLDLIGSSIKSELEVYENKPSGTQVEVKINYK